MIERLVELDRKLLLWLNGFHHSSLDTSVFLISQTWFWIPLYGLLLWLTIKDYKKEAWFIVAGIGLTILLTDQITSSFMKPFFARLRPSHEPSLEGMLHHVRNLSGEIYVGGKYSFASGHAANTFGTATFFVLIFRKTRPWIFALIAWAAIMTYTRIYMGVHYPGDIIVGATLGVTCGWIGSRLSRWLIARRKAGAPA